MKTILLGFLSLSCLVLALWCWVRTGFRPRREDEIDRRAVDRCTVLGCEQPLYLEYSKYVLEGPATRRVRRLRCPNGHAWVSERGRWCEDFRRDPRRDTPLRSTPAPRAGGVRSTPSGQQAGTPLRPVAAFAGGASARPSIPGQQFEQDGARA